jgi:hypothetical protein
LKENTMSRHGKKRVVHEAATVPGPPTRPPQPLLLDERDQEDYYEDEQPAYYQAPQPQQGQLVYYQQAAPQPQQVYYQPQGPDPATVQYLAAIHKNVEYLTWKVQPPSEMTWMAVGFTVFVGVAVLALTMFPFLVPIGHIILVLACIAFICIVVREHKKNKDA